MRALHFTRSPIGAVSLFILLASILNPPRVEGQIFVLGTGLYNQGTIGKFTTSGATINPSLITGLNTPFGMLLDGNGHIFVSLWGGNCIAEYSTSGAVINRSFITGLSDPVGMALDGNGHFFVANQAGGTGSWAPERRSTPVATL